MYAAGRIITALKPSSLDAAAHLGDRRVDVLERHDADAVEAGRAPPSSSRAASCCTARHAAPNSVGVLDPREHRGGVEHRDVDAFVVHVDQARVGVVAARPAHLRAGFFVPRLAADVGGPLLVVVRRRPGGRDRRSG